MQAKSHADSIGQGKMGSSVEVLFFNFELILTVPELLGFSQRPLFPSAPAALQLFLR